MRSASGYYIGDKTYAIIYDSLILQNLLHVASGISCKSKIKKSGALVELDHDRITLAER